jgi:predicted enzyme related to lactoylglutathione lyase
MSTHSAKWQAGTPCWIDVSVPDQERARAFYGELFGWEYDVRPPQLDHATATIRGRDVAGIGGTPDADAAAGWLTYLASDDAHATAAAITAAGGSLVSEPATVPGSGTVLVAVDPAGATFGVWQADARIGSAVVNEPGALVWNENLSRDWTAARAFYAEVFGLRAEPLPDGEHVPYQTLHLGGPPVGGIGELAHDVPQDGPSHWLAYLATLDTDASVQRAVELGATVVHQAMDTPYGRMAVLDGPQGERFAVMSVPEGGLDHRPSDD